MASLQQKRPSVSSVSNWFSSLRRQPKNKKSANLHTTDKQFQRSCIDLSSNSTFYVAPNAALHVTNKKSTTTPSHLEKRRNTTATAASRIATGVASTDSLQYDDDDRRGLVTGRRVSQLCSRCCCNVLAQQSRSHTPPSPNEAQLTQSNSTNSPNSPTTPKMPNSQNFTYSLATAAMPTTTPPFTSVAVYQIPTNTATSTTSSIPTTPTTSTLSSKTVISTDVSRDFKIMRLPSVETNTIILNKKSELKRTTTTTTTRTLIISRPIELLLNEKGEVISRRRPAFEKKTRSNSLGCVLDDNDEERDGGGDADSCASYSPRTTGTTLETIAGEGVEFRFIDDSSTSQSENERNSSQHNSQSSTQNDVVNIYNSNNTNNSYVGVGNVSGNNNNYDLCDVCKNVIQLNRNNIAQNAVIMRNNKQIKDELCEVVSEMEALDVPEDCKHSNKDKQMSIGRKKFNMDPKKGIEYLVENRLLRHDAQDVAHFLYKGEGLNKTAIGDYLGEKNDFNEDVLKAFVALHDFTNLILVQALRQFLWSFRLPGEAQKIDRMMECFAQRYCQLNPDIFTNTDTCYVLSFAIIMLNTSLHNPSVKDKPTVEQFISMNRGINNGGDLPRGLLESLYESIRTEPFKIPQDDGNDLMHTFFNPDKEGWLWKQGGRYKSWKRRWFILNDNCLYYFEYTTDKEPRGIIPLENISVREIHDRSKPHCFELFATGGADIIKACKTDSEGKVVEGKHTVYRMSAATEEDQQEWIKRLTQSISHNPFYDILVQRKKKALSKS